MNPFDELTGLAIKASLTPDDERRACALGLMLLQTRPGLEVLKLLSQALGERVLPFYKELLLSDDVDLSMARFGVLEHVLSDFTAKSHDVVASVFERGSRLLRIQLLPRLAFYGIEYDRRNAELARVV